MQCPVLTKCIVLWDVCYGGTDVAYGATQAVQDLMNTKGVTMAVCGTALAYAATRGELTSLECYGMCGTDVGYAGTKGAMLVPGERNMETVCQLCQLASTGGVDRIKVRTLPSGDLAGTYRVALGTRRGLFLAMHPLLRVWY
eukprot:2820553-Rhodomonas_salina.2